MERLPSTENKSPSLKKTENKSPSLKKAGTLSHPSPLMAELGKAMLKRKMTEPELSLRPKPASSSENRDISKNIREKESHDTEDSMKLKETAKSSEASSKEYTTSKKLLQSTNPDVPVFAKSTPKQDAEKEFTIDDKSDAVTLQENRKTSNVDITLTQSDAPAENLEPSTPQINQTTTTTVSICIEINTNESQHLMENEAVRRSKVLSDFFDPDHDTCLEYMYDSDEKTTIL